MGSFSHRLFRLAGLFGGVYATKVLEVMTENPKSLLSRLAHRYVLDPASLDRVNLQAALESFPSPERAKSILGWPPEFWRALNHMAERNTQELPEDELGAADPGMSAGLSLRVVEEFLAFMEVMDREGMRGKSGVPVWSQQERTARMVLGRISTVLDRLPSVWRSYIRDHITWSVTFDADPEENEAIVRAAFRAKLPEKFGVVLSKEASLLQHDSEEVRSTEGYYWPTDLSIHLYPSATTMTIAHEVGHAVWDRSMTRLTLRQFLREYIETHVPTKYMREVRQEWALEDSKAFFRALGKALSGLELRDTEAWIREAVEQWGEDYIEVQKETPMIREWGSLMMSRDQQDRLLDHVVEENKALLATWNEGWAEGFAQVLVQANTDIEVPGVLVSLVLEILAMGQLP